jgi:hypothetical protein
MGIQFEYTGRNTPQCNSLAEVTFHTKLDDRGHTCMFVGYSTTHAGNTYRMWDPRSRRVHITRDILWLNKMFFNQSDNVRITYTRGISRNLDTENLEVKSVKSDDNQNNNDNKDKSVEDLVSELFDDAINDNAGKGGRNMDKSGEQITTTRFGRSVRPPAKYDEHLYNVNGGT